MHLVSTEHKIRTLTTVDIPAAMALSEVAGWNQTEADWRRLLQLEPAACLAIEADGKVVASTTLVCFQDQLAWLGMVLTHPCYRKRGFARRLVETALEIADARKIRSVKLDATEQGLALYRTLGFREEQVVERWSGAGRNSPLPDSLPALSDTHLELDFQAFGADRFRVLNALPETGYSEQNGFAFCRPGARATHLGPCVSESAECAERLIERCLSVSGGQWYWDLLATNQSAVQIARQFDFKVNRTLVRMVRGLDLRASESFIYAGSGFELG